MTPDESFAFWRGPASRRVEMMRAGLLSMQECCRWASRRPHEVPLVNGEFEFITAFTPEGKGD